jgi:hypothetical protein
MNLNLQHQNNMCKEKCQQKKWHQAEKLKTCKLKQKNLSYIINFMVVHGRKRVKYNSINYQYRYDNHDTVNPNPEIS